MPDSNLSRVRDALEQRFRRGVVAGQPNRATVTLNLLKKEPGSGKNVAFDISTGTAVGQVFDDGEDVSTYNDDLELPATLEWGEYGDAIAITGRAEDASAGDSGEMGRLYLKKLRNGRDRAAAKTNLDLIAGTGSTGPQTIHGLTASAGPLDSTGTYAGVDRATYPQFGGNVLANAGVARAISFGLLGEAFQEVYNDTGEVVSVCVTTPQIWDNIAALVEPHERFVKEVTLRGQKFTLDAGFHVVMFRGVPILKDKDWTAGTLGGLSLDHLGIEELPAAASSQDRGDIIAQLPIAGTPEEQMLRPDQFNGGARPLMANLYKLARTGRKSKFQLVTTCQLWCDRPAANFLLKDIQE